ASCRERTAPQNSGINSYRVVEIGGRWEAGRSPASHLPPISTTRAAKLRAVQARPASKPFGMTHNLVCNTARTQVRKNRHTEKRDDSRSMLYSTGKEGKEGESWEY